MFWALCRRYNLQTLFIFYKQKCIWGFSYFLLLGEQYIMILCKQLVWKDKGTKKQNSLLKHGFWCCYFAYYQRENKHVTRNSYVTTLGYIYLQSSVNKTSLFLFLFLFLFFFLVNPSNYML